MKDPRRLLSGDATGFERLLLGAAAHERPTELQRRQMRRALGLSQLGLMLMSAKALAGVASQSVVVAVIAASLAGGSSTPRLQPSASVSSVTSNSQSKGRLPQALGTSASPVDVEPSEVIAADPPARSVEADPPVSKPGTGVRAAGSARKLPDLREEIALMDQARSALRNGAPTRAIGVLEQYRGRFPHGSFGQEATVLRIEALAASGNRSKAVAEANGFLSRNPNSPHSERLRRIIGGS